MKERPILFSAPMVRAILDGTKTQTRRVAPISSLDIREHDEGVVTWRVAFSKPIKGTLASYSGGKFSTDQACRIVASQFCPYGQPGDRLWVRETFQPLFAEGTEHGENEWITGRGYAVSYPATDGIHEFVDADDNLTDRCWPSIHMPRWASRITLEITGVRVERLQDISEADAIAEGIERSYDQWRDYRTDQSVNYPSAATPIESYRTLWEQINGSGSWDTNPWVWVVDFKRVEGGAA